MDIFERIRKEEFIILDNYIYLNHAAISAMPKRSFDNFELYAKKNREQAALAVDFNVEILEQVRSKIARFINAKNLEIAFTKNTTSGLILAANSIDLKEGDNIILVQNEFPANIYPWTAKKDEGIEIRFAPEKNNRVDVNDIIALCDERTKIISISLVEFHNGFRNDIKALSKFTRDKGIYLCVDGIQGLGVINFDVKEIPVDFLSTGTQKWLLGPEGLGFLYINEKILDNLKVPNPGWLRREDFFNFQNINQKLINEAKKFEEGALNFSAIFLFNGSIDLFLEVGIDNIEKRIMELTDFLIDGLKKKNYQIVSPIENYNERSGIISFKKDGVDIEKLYEHLIDKKIICSLRNGNIRISPHFYNNFDDIKFLLNNL